MRIRRVVTAVVDGKSKVVQDGGPPREAVLVHTPGFVSSPIWSNAAAPDLAAPAPDTLDTRESLLAPLGGATFLVVTFPPDSVMMAKDFDPAQAGGEHASVAPGIAETFELDNPGMHRTPTLDYVTVVSGSITLELDDGATIELRQGDVAVQHGVRHAWRNPGDEPATLSFVMLRGQ